MEWAESGHRTPWGPGCPLTLCAHRRPPNPGGPCLWVQSTALLAHSFRGQVVKGSSKLALLPPLVLGEYKKLEGRVNESIGRGYTHEI